MTNKYFTAKKKKDIYIKEKKMKTTYLYHGTSEGSFRNIREQGLIPQDGKMTYLSNTEKYAKTYAERKGNSFGNRILRVKQTRQMIQDNNTGLVGDYKTSNIIEPKDIEVKIGKDWISIQDYSDESINIMPILKPIAYYSIAGELGIEIVNIEHGVDDTIYYRYTNDQKVFSSTLITDYDSDSGTYDVCFKDENGTMFSTNDFMRVV